MATRPLQIKTSGSGDVNDFGFAQTGVSPFLVWGDFHACSRFACSTIPEEKWGTTRSLDLQNYRSVHEQMVKPLVKNRI